MAEATKVIDEPGQSLQPKKAVRVQWRAQWYRGTVVKLGPQPNLLKLRDLTTNATILLEARNVKVMEANTLDKQFYVGRRVGYHDHDEWKEAIIISNKAVGDVLVRWRKTATDPYNDSWFESANVAFHSQDSEDGDDVASHDSVEQIQHIPGSMSFSSANDGPQLPLPPIPQSHSYYSTIPASPTYESLHSMLSRQPLPPQMLMHHAYRPMHMYAHFQRLRTGIDPMGMETMSLPGLRLHPTTHSGGIPHHISSHFFRNLSSRRQQQGLYDSHCSTLAVHPSLSVPASEPVPRQERTCSMNTPQKEHSNMQVLSTAENNNQHPPRHTLTKRPNPYEVPQPSRTNLKLGNSRNIDRHEEKTEQAKRLCIQSSSPTELRVEVDGSALLSVIVNVSECDFTWHKNEEQLLGGQHISVLAPNILHLQHATQADTGVYKCVISHGSDTITYTCNVTVFEVRDGDSTNESRSNEVTYAELNMGLEKQGMHTTENAEVRQSVTTTESAEDNKSISKMNTASRNEDTSVPISMEHGEVAANKSPEAIDSKPANRKTQTTGPIQIVVSSPPPRIQKRISTILKTDVQDYLHGYGEDYGATSSATNIDEGVQSYSLPVGDDSPSPSAVLSPTSLSDDVPMTEYVTFAQQHFNPHDQQPDASERASNNAAKRKKGFFNHKVFKREKMKKRGPKNQFDVALATQSDAAAQNESIPSDMAATIAGDEKQKDTTAIMNNEAMTQMTEYPADDDSVNVNTSLDGSSGSEKASLNAEADIALPSERETVADLVRKLQLATQAHTPQFIIQQHQKKKPFGSNFFRGKSKQCQ